MNKASTIAPSAIGSVGLDGLLALVGLPSKRSTGELSGHVVEVFNGITALIDGLLLPAIDAHTAEEFRAVRDVIFGDYARAVIALSGLVQMVVPEPTIERILGESFCEMEAEFKAKGLLRFGAPAKEQAIFTIWTLRRTSSLIAKIIAAGPVSENLREQDSKIASEFSAAIAWTQFHLDCLVCSIRFDKEIQIDVLEVVQDGLRAVVNAYGLARRGLVLRAPSPEPVPSFIEWDDEDQELLESSMKDMAAETL
jgi:hypothetical protein